MLYTYCGTDGRHLWGLPADPLVALTEADLGAAGYTPAAAVAAGLYAASDPDAPARKARKAAPVDAPEPDAPAPSPVDPAPAAPAPEEVNPHVG